MDTPAPGSSGLLGSLRGFADGLLGSVHDRVELFSLELHEEKHRLVQILIWISAIVFTGLRARIAEHRWECIEAAATLARPLQWMDRVVATWRRFSPLVRLAGLPLAWMVARRLKLFSRIAKVTALARSLPLILNTARMVAH